MVRLEFRIKVDKGEEKMKIAFILLVHQGVSQVNRLINRLNDEKVDFFIHVDKNSGREFFNELSQSLSQYPNVFFTERIKCYWGHYSLVKATLIGLKSANSNVYNYDHYILLSGQDYPIKPINNIIEFLEENKGISFLRHTQFPFINWYEGGFARTKYWYINKLRRKKGNPSITNRVISRTWSNLRKVLPERKYLSKYFVQYGGSQWWCLTGEMVDYIVQFLQENKKYERFFKYVEIPDEIFFQTILLNSPYKDKIVNDNLRYMVWRDNTESPSVLMKNDFNELLNNTNLFARKFDVEKDYLIMNLIDDYILYKNNNTMRVK